MKDETIIDFSKSEQKHADRESRFSRLLWLIKEIRNDPFQDLKSILSRAEISRSQFYKDKDELAKLGFVIEYKTNHGFQIVEDRVSPIIDFTLSDRILLMFALRNLYSSGDGHLVAIALETGRKLASGLSEPFKTQILEEFEHTVCRIWGQVFYFRTFVLYTGIPFAGAVEARSGARQGPWQTRDMSSMIRKIHPVTRINPYAFCRVGDVGDVHFNKIFDVESSHADITDFIEQLYCRSVIPISAGGDHSIPLPIMRTLANVSSRGFPMDFEQPGRVA